MSGRESIRETNEGGFGSVREVKGRFDCSTGAFRCTLKSRIKSNPGGVAVSCVSFCVVCF